MRLQTAFAALMGILYPTALYAAGVNIDPCPIAGLGCYGGNLNPYIDGILGSGNGTTGIVAAFVGILIAMLVFYGLKLIVSAENDSTTSEVKVAYGHAIIGTILVGGATLFSTTFATPAVVIADPAGGGTYTVLSSVILSFKGVVYTALVFNLAFQGYRLVLHTDESQAEKAKKQFLYGMIGAALVILTDAIVTAFTGANVTIVSDQAKGITEFLLTILGALCVIALFVAGIFLVLSVDEQLKERAKKTILTSLVVLAVVILSLAILTIFVEAPLP